MRVMARKLYSLLGNGQKLDGGSMFGNAPRALWQRWARIDDQHRIELACRCLLVREAGRQILFETGIGAAFGPELRERYGVQESRHVLLEELARVGTAPEELDLVVLSHLHFDHAGGLLEAYEEGKEAALAFPKARFLVGKEHWERAIRPHPRDRASFLPELPKLLEESGRLGFIEGETHPWLGEGYRFLRSDGHTPDMRLVVLEGDGPPLLFCADLVPGRAWVRQAITMGYDRYPELLIDEKTAILTELAGQGGRLFFTHDKDYAVCALTTDARGRIAAGDCLAELRGEELAQLDLPTTS